MSLICTLFELHSLSVVRAIPRFKLPLHHYLHRIWLLACMPTVPRLEHALCMALPSRECWDFLAALHFKATADSDLARELVLIFHHFKVCVLGCCA